MKPKSLSASALQVAEACLARYKAENIERSRGISKHYANLGSACHGALEEFIKLNKLCEGPKDQHWDLVTLMMLYRVSYMKEFSTSEASGEIFDDGVEMLTRWFGRQDFEGVEVLSVEIKESFPVKTSVGEIPFNFIWDRHDKIGEGVYKVVDYKTNRWALTPTDLKTKIQARCYGLAAQIKYPDAKEIWVEFDMLRHDPVGVVYSREENIATWKFIKELAEKILATDPDYPPETLNPECRFCVRKLRCGALQKNIASGGTFGISSAQEAIDLRATLDFQLKAIGSAILDLDEIIMTEAKEADVLEFESDMNRLEIVASSTRAVDSSRAEMVLGPAIFRKYGSTSLTMKDVDKLLKPNSELTDQQRKDLKALLYKKRGEPRVKVTAKNGLDED